MLGLTHEARLRDAAEYDRSRHFATRRVEAVAAELDGHVGNPAPLERREQGLKPLRVLVEDAELRGCSGPVTLMCGADSFTARARRASPQARAGTYHGESRQRRHAIDHLLRGAGGDCGVEARVRRPSQPACFATSRQFIPTSPSPTCRRSCRTRSPRPRAAAFTQLLKEGYAVGPRQQMQQSRPMDRVPERRGSGPSDRRGPPRGPRRPPGGNGPDKPRGGPGGPSRPRKPPKGKPRLG